MEALDVEVLWSEKKKAIYLNTDENNISQNKYTAKEIYDRCSKSVFQVEVFDMEGDVIGTGSGFVLKNEGIAVTNFHVLEDAFSAKAYFTDGTEAQITGVLGYDAYQDWVVMKLEKGEYPHLELANSENIQGGEKIFTLGSPMGLSNTISEGLISNPNRMVEGQQYIQISAPISEGSSGGALLNERGQVIGITTAGYNSGQNLNFAIPIQGAKSAISSSKVITLEQMLKEWTIKHYSELPEAFEVTYQEEEPNDTLEESDFVSSGVTMLGEIDNDYLDSYYVVCNMPGTIEIACYSDSSDFERLALMVKSISDASDKGKIGEFYQMQDGKRVLYISVPVAKAGYYQIMLGTEDTFHVKQDKSIDYMFYYKFIPQGVK